MGIRTQRGRDGFSLLELVIVVVIIGIIAAIAVPRLSRGAAGAADSSLTGDLAVLRHAIDHYAVEHNGTYPAVATIADQLTLYTSAAGATNATKDATYCYGPYLSKVPPLPVGSAKDATGIAAAAGTGVGWVYNAATGAISAATAAAETDPAGKRYCDY